MKIIRSHLGIKLFLSYFVVIVVGMAVIGIITKITTPRAFARHLLFMEQQLGTGQGHGQGQGLGAGGMMSDFYQNFQQSFNESLLISVAAASLVALLVSFIFSKNILGPVSVMTSASRRIAEGHYDERVELRGNDELNQLAGSFNQMAEQLEQVESMRRQLIGDVAHELRTPLTAIKGTAEALMDGVLPASTETYQQIHSEAGRLSRLVDDLQELSRVESRSTQLDIHPVDSASLIQTVTKRLKYQFDEKRVKLTLSLPRDPIHVLADEGRILQVLTNLIGNALQYTPEHGTVTISIERDKMKHLFPSLTLAMGNILRASLIVFTVWINPVPARGGSGIGLTIAKHLVESHGGRIWARSVGKEKGSVFIFTLPLAK